MMLTNLAKAATERESAVRGPQGEQLDFELIYSDGVPLDTPRHRLQMDLLLELTDLLMIDRGRTDFYAGGDMFLYYSVEQARFMVENAPGPDEAPSPEYRQFMGPDYFLVNDAPWRPDRKAWIVWEEGGRYPQIIIELTSPSTAKIDRTVKKQRYERVFHTAEYYMYRPDEDRFQAFHMGPKHRYRKAEETPIVPGAVTASSTWVWSEHLGVWLGLWEGEYLRYGGRWLRFYDADGHLIPNQRERVDAAEARADAVQARANAAEARADAVQTRADAAEAQASAAEARADAAAAEIARLRALLAEK